MIHDRGKVVGGPFGVSFHETSTGEARKRLMICNMDIVGWILTIRREPKSIVDYIGDLVRYSSRVSANIANPLPIS